MFKSWSKKNKIKAVFKLQFQVTQVPKLKKPALMISLVPEDVGKPTVRLEKVAVQDGTCTWENPVYEPMRLIRDTKTGKINEKLYFFIVSTGSSKSGYVGEASIDFAELAAETVPLTMSLPLKFANSGAVLHIMVQRMQETDHQSVGDAEENVAPRLLSENSFDGSENQWDIEGNVNFNEDQNLTGYICKNEEHEAYYKTTAAYQDATTFLLPFRQKPMSRDGLGDGSMTSNNMHHRSNTGWSADSISDICLGDSPSSVEDNNRKEKFREPSDDFIEKLKKEIDNLMRQAELSDIETQTLRKQIAKETKQGQNLSRQNISMQEEINALELECERLRSLQKSSDEAEVPKRLQAEIKDTRGQLEALTQELDHEMTLRSNLQVQLHKTQDSNSELILVVKDLENILELKNQEISDVSSKLNTYKMELDEQNLNIKQLALLKKDTSDLSLKFKQYREEQEAIMETERSGYIETIEELESQVERSEEIIKKQAREFSESLISINELENQVKTLEVQLEKQAKEFEDNLDAMTCAKSEQEKRAIQAEETLRKMRLNEVTRVENLQEELKRLSLDMATKVEEKEKQGTEANELRQQNKALEDRLQEANKDMGILKRQERMKLQELTRKMDLKVKQIEQMSLEIDDKSQQLKCVKEHEKEKNASFLTEIQMLKEEIDRLNKDKSDLGKLEDEKLKLRDDVGKLKALFQAKDKLIQNLKKEKYNLEKNLALAKQETEAALKMNNINDTDQGNFSDLLTEMALLKEKNTWMEKELKEMQGRYSEISLRFAEVEGERQQLVMTVRNLRSIKN